MEATKLHNLGQTNKNTHVLGNQTLPKFTGET